MGKSLKKQGKLFRPGRRGRRVFSLGWIACVLVLFWACQAEPGDRLELLFADESQKGLIVEIDLFALRADGLTCEPLLRAGAAVPADAVVSQTSLAFPLQGRARLPDVPNGSLLFLAQGKAADGAVLLRGCQPVRVAGGRALRLSIELSRVCPPGPEGAPGSPACWDAIDNDCDGVVDLEDPDCRPCAEDPDCDDHNPCTDDRCDPAVGCAHTPDDGNPCTDNDPGTLDACVAGQCVSRRLDVDQDQHVSVSEGGDDCDDTNPAVYPGNLEKGALCADGLDNDCDGLVDGQDPDCSATFEVEDLLVVDQSTPYASDPEFWHDAPGYSGRGYHYWCVSALGQYLAYRLDGVEAGRYALRVKFLRRRTQGIFQLTVRDGSGALQNVGAAVDTYANVWDPPLYDVAAIGTVSFPTGQSKEFWFTVTGQNPAAQGFELRLDALVLTRVP